MIMESNAIMQVEVMLDAVFLAQQTRATYVTGLQVIIVNATHFVEMVNIQLENNAIWAPLIMEMDKAVKLIAKHLRAMAANGAHTL